MNTLTLSTLAFLAGMACAFQSTYTHHDLESAVLTAHEIGLNKCPPDTHCVDHGGVKGLVRLTLDDVESML